MYKEGWSINIGPLCGSQSNPLSSDTPQTNTPTSSNNQDAKAASPKLPVNRKRRKGKAQRRSK
jgi:hypothetical protein